MINENVIKRLSVFFLILLSIFLSFFNLSKHPPQVWDEQTNIDVVNSALPPFEKEGWGGFVLYYQNEPFFEKPPLWYWGTMGATDIFCKGTTSCAPTFYRLLSALSGVGIVLTVYFISKNAWGHWAGIVSGFSILSIGHLFINNVSGYFSTHTFRSADLDALQIFFIIISFAFYLNHKRLRHSDKNRNPFLNKLNIVLVFLFSALAIMTKGPIGFLPITILLFNHPKIPPFAKGDKGGFITLLKKIWRIIKNHHLLPFSVFFLIILPWHIWMYIKFGSDFIDKYFLYHMVKRATETIEEHNEDFLFYIRMFWNVNVFAVGIPTLVGIFIAIKNKVWKKDIGVKIAMLGILIPLILFTLVPTKLAWYNLYIYPFAALMTGWLFAQKWKNENLNFIKNATIIILIAVGIVQNISWVLSLS